MTITLAGQSMIRSDIRVTAPAAFETAKSLLQGDVKFTNFEGTVFKEGQLVKQGAGYQGRGYLSFPGTLGSLKALGFNLVSLSNNHAFDLREAGVKNTLAEADELGMVHAGTGNTMAEAAAPAYLQTPGGKVAFIASASGLMDPGARATESSPGLNEMRIKAGDRYNGGREELPIKPDNTPDPEDASRILKSIREARAHADLVIVSQHNHVFSNRSFSAVIGEGLPERLEPPVWLKKWAHEEIDAGADIVAMHGAPLLHGIEIYHGKPIFYDLGNFIFNLPPAIAYREEPIYWESVVAKLKMNGRRLESITLQPIVMNAIGEGQPDVHDQYTNNQFLDTRGLPAPATGMQGLDILNRIAAASKRFGTKLKINNGIAEIQLSAR